MLTNQKTVISSESPRNFLKWFIHFPGLGKSDIALGKAAVNRKGDASPIPTEKKISKITKGPEVKAKARAVPRNGAEHGVDSIVASTPLRKSPFALQFESILKYYLLA